MNFLYRQARITFGIVILFFVILGSSCSVTKYVPQDEYMLNKHDIEIGKAQINQKEMETYIRQKPNKRVLGVRFHLFLYNLSKEGKDNWFHRWLRNIGEEPVLYDDFMTEKSSRQLNLYMKNKGYFDAEVNDSVKFRKKKANVTYFIVPNKPYTIKSINYNIEDSFLRLILLPDTANSILKVGNRFDTDILELERIRIENYLKNLGYFKFSKEFVQYKADSMGLLNQVKLTIEIRKFQSRTEDGRLITRNHQRFQISDVFVRTDFDPVTGRDEGINRLVNLDTLLHDNIHFIYADELIIKPKVIAQSIFLEPGMLYKQNDVDKTYRHLSSLRSYRFINFRFEEIQEFEPEYEYMGIAFETVSNEPQPLIAKIDLTPGLMQSYSIELEGTNSSGDIGAAGNVIYQHRNLFRGAEIFDFKVRGAIETFNRTNETRFRNTIEFGTEANLRLPKFLLPFGAEKFTKKFNPRTVLTGAYNYQRRPDYTRTIATASFGYNWHGNRYNTHIVHPFDLNLVKLHEIDSVFQSELDVFPFLRNSYQDHFVSLSSYSFIFNNQNIKKVEDFVFLRLNFEIAGNILRTINTVANTPVREDSVYRLLGLRYSQYAKTDIDFRYYQVLRGADKLVYRIFAGAGLPYLNSTSLPFEKKYFSGGANSIRAWQVRTLGPGTYSEGVTGRFPNITADIKVEANIEYRFKLFWLLEGAVFLDVGNIWAINEMDEREGALFKWNKFYNDFAFGTGFGTRFDFSFFIFRLDVGLKLRDPALPENDRWIIGTRPLARDDFAWQIGIGYPF